MHIAEVNNNTIRKQFHKVPYLIYKRDSNWTPPIQGLIEDIFNADKNKALIEGKAIRWILLNDDNQLIGRIAAFINPENVNTYEQPTGGCGFFECIDDQEAADTLFKTAVEWLKENGMKAMDGPVNLGPNYLNWGLLVDGFVPQGYGMPYNPKYYEKLFRNFGFEVYFEQYSYHLDYSVPFPKRFWKIAGWIAKKPGYNFKHFNFNEANKFVKDFCEVYDAAWSSHEHFKPIDPKEAYNFIQGSKAILDPEMIWFAYHDEKPIAMFVMLPDINQILHKLNGKLNLWGILKFMYYKKKKVMTRTRIILMGIDPKYQRYGIDSAIFWHQDKLMKKKPQYTEVELSWAGDFNPKVISLYENTGAKRAKTHYTMRYLFDRDIPFKRAPILE